MGVDLCLNWSLPDGEDFVDHGKESTIGKIVRGPYKGIFDILRVPNVLCSIFSQHELE